MPHSWWSTLLTWLRDPRGHRRDLDHHAEVVASLKEANERAARVISQSQGVPLARTVSLARQRPRGDTAR